MRLNHYQMGSFEGRSLHFQQAFNYQQLNRNEILKSYLVEPIRILLLNFLKSFKERYLTFDKSKTKFKHLLR